RRANTEQQRVAVAVVPDLLDGERAARGRTLVPVLPPRPAPEPRLAGLARPPQSLVVHPGEHEHATVGDVLDDRRHQLTDRRARQLLTGHPASRSSAFSSRNRSGRSWTIDATSAASAPTAKASARCRVSPAPPEAITGVSTTAATAPVSSRS